MVELLHSCALMEPVKKKRLTVSIARDFIDISLFKNADRNQTVVLKIGIPSF